MKKNQFCLMITIFFFLIPVSGAQERGIAVSLTGQEVFETEPKNVVTTTFDVRNTTAKEQELTAHLILPKGWKNLTGEFPFTLGPGANKIELVSFFVPGQTLAGKYEITYMVRAKTDTSVRDFKTIYVVVLPVSRLRVKLMEAPEFVIAGQDYQAVFIIINESNTENVIRVAVDSSYNLPWNTDLQKLRLGPGESGTVKVTVKTDEKTRKKLKHLLRVIAQGPEENAEASAYTDIIPRVTVEEDRFRRIPSKITLRQIVVKEGEYSSGFQAEFSGEGTLDEQGKKHIKFLLKGPDIQDRTSYGERDEYSIRYWTENYDLFLGDNSYSLSSLTENYLYGRGIRGNLYLDNFSIGTYHMKTRWLDPDEEQSAFNIGYLFDEKYRIRLNFLKKNEKQDSKTISLEGRFRLTKKTNLEVEWARGSKEDGHDNAYWVNLHGSGKRISYYLKYIWADPGHPGYYRDKEFISGNLSFPINQKLTLTTSFRQEKNNLDQDISLDSAPLERYGQFGVDYRFSTGSYISFYSQVRTYEDQFPDPDFDYVEKSLRIGLGRNYDMLSLYASAEKGIKEERLENYSSDLDRYTGSVYFRPDKKQTYTAYLRYSDDEFYERDNSRSINAGLGAGFRFSGKTRLSIDLQTYNYLDSGTDDRDTFEVSADHTLSNKHSISGKVRHTSYRNSDEENETLFFAEYTVPVGVPAERNKNVGMIKGYLFDKETGRPIPETILWLNGATAVTDKNGTFSFPSVRPGTHYLDVDQAGIGLKRITAHKTPLNVSIEGGREAFINIAVTRSASLSGRVMSYQFSDREYGDFLVQQTGSATHLIKKGPLGNVLVEIKADTEIKRRLTDNKGYFRFEELRPGKWKIKIYADNLPEYHYLEKDMFEFELSPGAEENIFVRALPRRRQIQIISQGGTLTEKPLVATVSPARIRPVTRESSRASEIKKKNLSLEKITVISSGTEKKRVALGKLATRSSEVKKKNLSLKKITIISSGTEKKRVAPYKLAIRSSELKKPEAKKPEAKKSEVKKKSLTLGKLTARLSENRKDILILGRMTVRGTEIKKTEGLPYSVQVATCSEKENAQKVVNKLKQRGYKPYLYKAVDSASQTWYKVRLGDYATMEKASQAAVLFRKKEGKPVIIQSNGIKIFYL